jgi:hypothetical protein
MARMSARSPLQALRQAVYPLASRLLAKAWVAEGTLKDGSSRMRILFVHNCLFNRNLQQRTFLDCSESAAGHLLIPRLPGIIRRNALGVDLVCAVLPRAYATSFEGLPHHQGREEVRQVISTRCSWEVLREGFSKKRRQISNDFPAKTGLSYRMSRDPAEFDHFYHHMYAPHIRRRYGELAEIDGYDDLRSVFSAGLLLFVLSGGKPVAGALSSLAGDTLLFRRTGVLDGDESHVKGGAQTALYYFQLRHAVDSGLAALDTLKSSPFLNDGVFKHKADWGARAIQDDEATRLVFLFPSTSQEKLVRFFEINPMIVDHGASLSALIGDSTAGPGAAAPSISRSFQTLGLESVELYTGGGRQLVALQDEAVAGAGTGRQS